MLKFDGKPMDVSVHHGVLRYFTIYMMIFFISVLLISLNTPGNSISFINSFTAVAASINNVGPGFGDIGPLGNYSAFGGFAKLILALDMLIGRLEILPMLLLFYPKLWLRR